MMAAITQDDMIALLNRSVPDTVLNSAATGYFRSLLRESEGVLTPDILQEADWLFDVVSTRDLADVLGLTTGELRKALARQRVIICADCGEQFVAMEPRRKGGYTKSHELYCEECKEQRSQARWERRRQQELEQDKRRRYDAEILAAIEAGGDPLQLKKLHQYLITYALYWISDYQRGPGCMICAQEPVHLLVITKEKAEALTPDDMGNVQSALISNETWSPLISVYQTLWRLSPRAYFQLAYHFPLKRMPVVLLCDDHLQIVENTHTEIPIKEVH